MDQNRNASWQNLFKMMATSQVTLMNFACFSWQTKCLVSSKEAVCEEIPLQVLSYFTKGLEMVLRIYCILNPLYPDNSMKSVWSSCVISLWQFLAHLELLYQWSSLLSTSHTTSRKHRRMVSWLGFHYPSVISTNVQSVETSFSVEDKRINFPNSISTTNLDATFCSWA